MATLLHIETSPRKERSHSMKVAEAFIAAYRAAHPEDTVDTLDLWSAKLPEFDGDMINAKYSLMHGENPTGGEASAWEEVTGIFKRFDQADKYLLSVPMWNFSIPYKLKHYIDVITQPGLAWSFSPDTGYSGLVTGRAAAIYSSAGVYDAASGAEAFDNQKPYVEAWLGFIGITDVSRIACAPMLAAPDDVAKAEEAAIAEAKALAEKF